MASAPQPAQTARTVVLLRPAERKRLEKLAAAEKVSSGEILRRSLQAYDQQPTDSEQELLAAMLKEMNTALDASLKSIRSARAEIQANLKKIEELQAARG
jgi:hypothetical protein